MGDDRDLPTPDSASEWEPRADRRDWVPLKRMTTWHRDDTPWHKAPLPPRRHICRAQSVGIVFSTLSVLRCACGATAHVEDGFWTEVNTRRDYLESIGEIEPELPGNSILSTIRNLFRSLGNDS